MIPIKFLSLMLLLGVIVSLIAPSPVNSQASGVTVTDFTLPVVGPSGLTGQQASLSQFYGKVILLEFMEPWSSHCQNMAPVLDQLYSQYGGGQRNVVFVSVAGPFQGATADDVAHFIEQYNTYGSGWTNLYDQSGSTFSPYQVTATPTFYIINVNRIITAVHVGETALPTLASDIAAAAPQRQSS